MATMPILEAARSRFIPVSEYLSTVYRPDCHYVDGHLEERNVGEFDHGSLQALLAHCFIVKATEWGVRAATDVRMRIKPTRVRIPDVLVQRRDAVREQVLTRPPLLVIEILSPEDRLNRVTKLAAEYVEFGIENVWIVDPAKRLTYRVTAAGRELVASNQITVANSPIHVDVNALFAELD